MDRPHGRVPWLLVAGSALLALLLFYVLFGAYLPAKRQIARLEAELKDVYAREAALQNTLALRDQQMMALVAEREALARRLEDLQRELTGRGRR